MPYLKNTRKSTLMIPIQGARPLTLRPLGDSGGQDNLLIDETTAARIEVRSAVSQGLVTLVSEEEEQSFADERNAEARQRAEEAAEARKKTLTEVIDYRQENDISGRTCIAPGERPQVPCGAIVVGQATKDRETAPLCSRHQGMAGQYTYTEIEDPDVPGQTRGKWQRVTVTH